MNVTRKVLLALLVLFVMGCGDSNNNDFVFTGNQNNPTIALIQVTPAGSALAAGTTRQMTATAVLTNGTSQDVTDQVTWTSSPTTIATVSDTGLVTGVAPGEATITATLNGVSGSTNINVTSAVLTGLEVTPATLSRPAGVSEQFRAIGSFSDGSSQDLTSSADWDSSSDAVATVSDLGLVRTVAPGGPVTITASFGGFSDTASVTVTDATLVSIAVTADNFIIPIGLSEQLTATGTYSDGSEVNITNDVTWNDANDNISISATGLAPGVAVGPDTATATLGAVSGSLNLAVSSATLTSIALTPPGPYALQVGSSRQLVVTGTFSDGSVMDVTDISTFVSDNTADVTVSTAGSDRGLISGVGVGTANIGVSAGGFALVAVVNVTAATEEALVYVVDGANNLVRTSTTTPGTTLSATITGLAANQTLEGIDFRPQNGFLYGLAHNSVTGAVQLYCISTAAGAGGVTATAVGNPLASPTFPSGTRFGFDFNPAADRIRVTTSTGGNFRINPNNGALAAPDATLTSSGVVTGITGSAYTNNQPGTTVTSLYALDSAGDQLFRQFPNDGILVDGVPVTSGGTGLDLSAINGFDISPGVNVTSNNSPLETGSALMSATVGGTTNLYRLDMLSGQASNLGAIGVLTEVRGLAIRPATLRAIALSGTNLLRFDTATPGTLLTPVGITGITAGETLIGIDHRPATGQLFALGVNSTADTGTIYVIDPQNGAGTVFGTASGVTAGDLPDPATTGYGFDFNPMNGNIRIVAGSISAAYNVTTFVTTVAAAVNGGTTTIDAAAYLNNFPGTASTTLYVLDAASNNLFTMDVATSATTVVGALGVDFLNVNGFDMTAINQAFAVLNAGGSTSLYGLNRTTGQATIVGAVGNGATAIQGFTLGN